MAVFGIGTKGVSIATAQRAVSTFGARNFEELFRAIVMTLLL
jgi:hypothetical protein